MDMPSLGQDDVKAQFDSIVSPYGSLFSEHHSLNSDLGDASPFTLTFSLNPDKDSRKDVPSASQLPASDITKQGKPRHLKEETQRNPQQPSSTRTAVNDNLNVHEAASEQSPHGRDKKAARVYSSDHATFSGKFSDSTEWGSSNRGPGARKDYRGSKSGSKLAKGWKKFRQSLRQSPSTGQEVKHIYGSRSSITEERRGEFLSVSSIGGRKAVSDMDNRLELDIDEPVGAEDFKSILKSEPLTELLHKGSPGPCLSELGVEESQLIRRASKDDKSEFPGGDTMVDVETIMGLGEIRRYSRDDPMRQQKQNQHSSEMFPFSETENIESGYGSLVSSSSSATDDSRSQLELDESSSEQDLDVADQGPQGQQSHGLGNIDLQHSGEDRSKAFPDNTPIQAEYFNDEVAQEMTQDNELINSSEQFLGLGHPSSQRWRLNKEGMPLVYGMIMQSPTIEQDLDHQDRTFKVPLDQSVELASATLENGQRVPLSIYYATAELRVRGASIDDLFPEDWDTEDETFEDLVGVFDNRPFGRDYDLFTNPLKADTSASHMGMKKPVEGLEVETGSSQSRNQDRASNDENVVLEPASRSVSSRDLSRIILRFLADLPEPLIARDVFTTFSSMIQLQAVDPFKTQASSLLVQMLSLEQRQLLKFLLEFLDEVVFKPLRDDIQRLEQLISMESTEESSSHEHQQDLDCRNSYLEEQMKRIVKVFGIACTHVVSPKNRADLLAKGQSQNLLYSHCEKESEFKALQDEKALAMRNSQEVLQFLMNWRVSVFGPSFVSLFTTISEEKVDTDSKSTRITPRRGDSRGEKCPNLRQNNRNLRNHLGPRRLAKRRFESNMRKGILFSILTRLNNGDGIQITPRSDSGVEVSSVDLVALAAMEEHKARVMRSKKHLPHPSMATLHSVQAETGSIVYAKDAVRGNNSGLSPNETQLLDVYEDDISSVTAGSAQDHELDNTRNHKQAKNTNLKVGVKDYLERPLNRKHQELHQELEVQMVEKEILRSEMTTKFLAASLTGLYPSSSPAPIPTFILPSARAMVARKTKTPGLCNPVEEPLTHNRELTLVPQEEIQLPSDHSPTENCTCTYCTTLIKPSKIPVLSRAEYDLAELQSQCDGKDQHIAELLKTVQNLQSQVNILNAKLLFLHDHHTTRPMRRRTLARNSYPLMPAHSNSQEGTNQKQCVSVQQHGSNSGVSGSHSPADRTNGNSPNIPGSTGAFPEGVPTANDAEPQYSVGLRFSFESPLLDENEGGVHEDDVVSFLDLDNSHPPPPPLPAYATQHNELSRMQTTAASNVGHAANFDRSMIANVREIRYETELERALREIDECEEEPEREGEDQLDEHYYLDAYKTMDQRLYRRPVLPVPPPPRPMSSEMYKKHHRMSLPIQSLMSKRISLGNTLRWKGRATAA
ncbi:hypothetical protein BGX21_008815 [Mortierella sp. AD011]|nr:hypothetical protein BGX20_000477 [Mortierella sp. AD010]KAF9397478.1 hypothetical protein BGX21_008815 [Mortierella sp. AD011]